MTTLKIQGFGNKLKCYHPHRAMTEPCTATASREHTFQESEGSRGAVGGWGTSLLAQKWSGEGIAFS